MNIVKDLLIVFIVSTVLIACNKKDDDFTSSCSFYEEHFGGLYNETFFSNQKAAQRLYLNRSALLKTITVEMDLLNSDAVKLSLLKDDGSSNPANAQLLTSTTITSSQNANIGKVEFNFAKPVSIQGGSIFLIFETNAGSFELTKQSNMFDLIGEIWKLNGGTWTKQDAYDISLSLSGGC